MPGCWPFFGKRTASAKKSSPVAANAATELITKKIVLIGPEQAGKTALVKRFTDKPFSNGYVPTVAVDFIVQDKTVTNRPPIRLHIWDTAGQERFNSIVQGYIKGAYGLLLCVDLLKLTDSEYLSSIEKIYQDIRKQIDDSKIPIILVGTKLDKQLEGRKIAETRLQKLQKKLGVTQMMMVSAKTGENVDALFTSIAEQMVPPVISEQAVSQEPPKSVAVTLTSKQQRYLTSIEKTWGQTSGENLDKAKAILRDYAKSNAYIPWLKLLATLHWRHHAIAVTKASNKSNNFEDLLKQLGDIQFQAKDFNKKGDLAAIIHFLNGKKNAVDTSATQPRQQTFA